MGGLHEFQIPDRRGLHHDVFEPRLLWICLDPREFLVEPDHIIANEHDVIARIHCGVGGVAVPQFPDSRRAIFNHVTPTRIFLLRRESVNQVWSPVFAEHAAKILSAHKPGSNVTAGFVLNLVH